MKDWSQHIASNANSLIYSSGTVLAIFNYAEKLKLNVKVL